MYVYVPIVLGTYIVIIIVGFYHSRKLTFFNTI